MPKREPVRDEQWEAQLRKGCLDLAILSLLWERRLYGLEILQQLEQTADLEVAEGTLYPILMRLKQDGLLESEWVEAEAGHPRKYYRLTQAGRHRAAAMARIWESFTEGMDRLLARAKGYAK